MLSHLFTNNSLLENKQVPRYCAIAFALISLAIITSLIIESYQTYKYRPINTNHTTKSSKPKQTSTTYKSQTITNKNLFGRTEKINLPQTQLQLVLRGAFTSSDPRLSSAIIEIPGKQNHSFKVNNTVYGNAKLHAVYKDRVILSRAGQLETLYFPKPQRSLQSSSTAVSQQSLGISSNDVDLIRKNASIGEIKKVASELSSPTMTAEKRKQLINQRLQELRNRARK